MDGKASHDPVDDFIEAFETMGASATVQNPFFSDLAEDAQKDGKARLVQREKDYIRAGRRNACPLDNVHLFRERVLKFLDCPGYGVVVNYGRSGLNQGDARAVNLLGAYDPVKDMVRFGTGRAEVILMLCSKFQTQNLVVVTVRYVNHVCCYSSCMHQQCI